MERSIVLIVLNCIEHRQEIHSEQQIKAWSTGRAKGDLKPFREPFSNKSIDVLHVINFFERHMTCDNARGTWVNRSRSSAVYLIQLGELYQLNYMNNWVSVTVMLHDFTTLDDNSPFFLSFAGE